MSNKRSRNRGFTLFEIIVAMAVGGLVMLGARQLFETLAQSARAVAHYTTTTAQGANGEMMLRELVRRAEVGLEIAPFDGTALSARFSTWCDVVGGWSERCVVMLVPNAATESLPLVSVLQQAESGDVRLLLIGVRQLMYFDGSSGTREWKHAWLPGSPLPLAMGLVRSTDTLILRIGQRG